MGARLAGELEAWPSKEGMADILRAAGLAVAVGVYSVRVEGHSRFKFQEYGGDLGDPAIDADAESVPELLATARLVSEALACAGVVHRFELYDDAGELAGYLHHGWPPPACSPDAEQALQQTGGARLLSPIRSSLSPTGC